MSSSDRAGEKSEQSLKREERAEKVEDGKKPGHEVLPTTERAATPEVASTVPLSDESDLEAVCIL